MNPPPYNLAIEELSLKSPWGYMSELAANEIF